MSRENVEIVRQEFVWTLRDGKVIRGAAFRTKSEALEATGVEA